MAIPEVFPSESQWPDRHLGQLLDDVGSAVLVTDSHLLISYSNTAAASLLGCANRDLIGRPAGILAAPWTSALEARPDQRMGGYMDRLEVGAAERWIDWQVSPVRDGTRMLGWLVLIQDRTNYRRSEQSARLAERLTTISMMVGALGHELRNHLSGAKGMLELMCRWPDHPRTKGYPALIIAELDQVTRLLNEFLALGRMAQIRCEPVDLVALVEELLPLLQGEAAGQSGEIQADLPPVPLVEADVGQLTQVILNLARNAIGAAGQAGRVLLRLRPAGEWVTLTVRDSGPGLTPEVMENLFRPFFTTKASGLGLGLFITQAIIHNYGGSVAAANAVEGGAEFTIRLPAKAATGPGRRPGVAVLLLANLMLRHEAEQALRVAGFRVVSAQNAAEVLHLVRLQQPVALMVDPDTLSTPGMPEIRRALSRTRVFVLGEPSALSDRAGLTVLPRPLAWTDVLAQIDAVLE